MKTIEVTINLDPVHDGATIRPSKTEKKRAGALVVGTNGDYRVVCEKEARAIMNKMGNDLHGVYLGRTNLVAVMNKKKIITAGDASYFIGSVLIIKEVKDGFTILAESEFAGAMEAFGSRLDTLVIDGQKYSALAIV